MIEKIFPKQANNSFDGSRIAYWFFVVITVVTIGRSLVHMAAPDGGAQSIATIPLDSFMVNGANTVVLMFSLWGLSQLLMGLVYLAVLWRYQNLIPFMYLLIFLEYSLRIVLGFKIPIETLSNAPGGLANYIIAPLAVAMFFLSLINRKA